VPLSLLRKKRILLASLSLVLILATRVDAVTGIVLCLEADGRVALEWLRAGASCAAICGAEEEAREDLHAAAHFTAAPVECACFDIPLAFGVGEPCRTAQSVAPTAPVLLPVDAVQDASAPDPARHALARALPVSLPPDSLLTQLRSVVLLI